MHFLMPCAHPVAEIVVRDFNLTHPSTISTQFAKQSQLRTHIESLERGTQPGRSGIGTTTRSDRLHSITLAPLAEHDRPHLLHSLVQHIIHQRILVVPNPL